MSLSKNKLFKKLLVYKSVILTFGSISFGQSVIAIPVEFICRINDSYGVSFGMMLDSKGRKKYPHRLFKIKSEEEEFEKLKVIFDVNTGKGTINGSDAQILSRKLDLPKEKGPVISNPIVLYTKAYEFDRRREKLDEENILQKSWSKSDKRYLILDKGEESSGSSFTLIDTLRKSSRDKKFKSSEIISYDLESNTMQEIFYGSCKKSKN